MRYRALDSNGDYQVGVFLTDTPEAVAQAVKTRLALWTNEWFLDKDEGTPWSDIVGFSSNYDLEIQERILGTTGVNSIISYHSTINNRDLSVECSLDTIYGAAYINSVINYKG